MYGAIVLEGHKMVKNGAKHCNCLPKKVEAERLIHTHTLK